MTRDDLLVLVPWVLFAASVIIIAVMVWRRRPTYPAAKPPKATKRRRHEQVTEKEPSGSGQARPSGGPQAAAGEQPWCHRPSDTEPQQNH